MNAKGKARWAQESTRLNRKPQDTQAPQQTLKSLAQAKDHLRAKEPIRQS